MILGALTRRSRQKGTKGKENRIRPIPTCARLRERREMGPDRNGCDGSLEWTPRVLWELLFLISS